MTDQYPEIWKDIRGLEGQYQASNHGRIKSCYRIYESRPGVRYTRQERILKPALGRSPYPNVVAGRTRAVHRIIAETFIPNPEKKPQVNHKNGIKTDNRAENLEWVTASENNLHSRRILGKARGEDAGKAILSENDVIDIRTLMVFGAKNADIKRAYGLKWSHVSLIRNRRCWTHI